MVIADRELARPYSTTCRVTGTTCRPNVRSGSIEAVPTWVVVMGWIAAALGVAIIWWTW